MRLQLDDIKLGAGTQPRAKIDEATVSEYAEAMQGGAIFPPVVVFYDGETYYLADGFHRVDAAYKLGLDDIEADVRQGAHRDAILFSVGANSAHGLRRTNDDKRRAVTRLLEDEEWSAWSDREIARRCAVSHEFVRGLRPEVSTVDTSDRRKAPDGKKYPAHPSKAMAPDPVYEMPLEDGPTGKPEAKQSYSEEARPAERQAGMVIDYLDMVLGRYPNLADKGIICNTVLIYVKKKAIEYNANA